MEWLSERIWPIEAHLTAEDCYIGSLLGCLESIKFGVTTFLDMYFFEDETAKACEKSGLRGVLAWPILDESITTQKGNPINNAEKFMKKYNKSELIKPAFGPHSLYTCSSETLMRTKEIADKYNALIHTHLSETNDEVKMSIENYNKRPVEYFESIGFLSKNLIAAHCVHVNEKEIKILKNNNVKISHCPVSNLKLASGFAPIAEMIEEGLTVTLGTDGCASNDNLDLFEEMKISALIQKGFKSNATLLPAQKILNMATIEGGLALGINTGSIEIGKKADVILLDLKKPHMQPFNNIISNLVYSAKGNDVSTVICNGKIIMENNKILNLNEDEIYEKAGKTIDRLKSKVSR